MANAKFLVKLTAPNGRTETIYSSFSEHFGQTDFDKLVTWAAEHPGAYAGCKAKLMHAGKVLRSMRWEKN